MRHSRAGARNFGPVAAVALAALVAAAPAAGAERRATPDGDAYAFSTNDQLVAADTDSASDAYVWRDGVHELVSTGTSTNSYARALSADGTRAVFSTADALTSADTDTSEDFYVSAGGAFELVSSGPADPDDGLLPTLKNVSPDAQRIVFTTGSPLVAEDDDALEDIYVYSGGSTALLSTSAAGNSGHAHSFIDSSLDGSRVFEGTDEPLVSGDADGAWDLYVRSGGTAKLVTTGTLGSPPATVFLAGGASDDGSSFVFATDERFELGDTNDTWDVYQRRSGRTRILTANRLGLAPECPFPDGGFGPPPCTIVDVAQTTDGATTFFGAGQRLVASDTDSAYDMYRRSGSSIELVAEGGQGWISPGGAREVFHTGAALVPSDTDTKADLYERENGQFTLLTPGTPSDNLGHAGGSRELDRVYFQTQEGVVAADTDNRRDVYESVGGTVRLVTTGPGDDHANVSASEHTRVDPSDDGSSVFFSSAKPLVAADTDTDPDVYVWQDGVTRLVSG